MDIRSQRGAIPVIWLVVGTLVAALGTGAVTLKKGFGIFHGEDTQQARVEAAALAQAADRAAAAEAAAAQARADADAAQTKLATQEKNRHEAVTEDVAGAIMALEKEPSPSLNVQAALTLSRSAYQNSDPISDARLDQMRKFVETLTAENAAIRATAAKQLADKDAALERERANETVLQQQVATTKASQAAAEAKAQQFAAQRDEAVIKTQMAIADVKTTGEKLASFMRWAIAFSVLLIALLWVFPIVAKAFPGVPWLAKLAKWSAGVLAGGLNALHAAEKKTAAKGLEETGRAIAAVRRELPQAAAAITDIFDRHISPTNQPTVAAAAGSTPPTT